MSRSLRYAARAANGWCFGEAEDDVLDLLDGDQVGETLRLPTRKEVCGRCRGEGSHDHPAFSNGITSSEWAEWDADEREDYRAGVYDVTCEECKGQRVVDVIEEMALPEDVREALYQWWREEADLRAMEAAERRMGA